MDKITEYLASYGTSIKYEDLPAEVVHKTKGLLIDTLGCALGGYSSEPAKIARWHAEGVYQCDMPATIIGSGYKSTPELATFANGTMIRYLDYNDSFTIGGGGHPSDNFAPVLTCADALHVGGKQLLVASVLAYEVFCRLGDQIARTSSIRGFDHSLQGVVSSALGASKILGLSRHQMAQAINLAVAPNITLWQTRAGEVSMWKGCAMANAGRNGIFAARLAKEGMTGPAPIFEGRRGLFNVVTGPFQLKEFGGNGRPFRIMDVSIKRYPCGNVAETDVDAAINLRSRISSVDDIAEINIETWDLAKNVMAGDPDKWHPKTKETADHSLPYVVCVALMYGTLETRHFDDEYLHNPDLIALMQKVKVTDSEECNKLRPDASPARVELVTKSGKKLSDTVLYWRGHYRNPLTDEEIEQKFHSQARNLLSSSQREELLSLIWDLEHAEDVGRIMELLKI